MLLSIIIPVYNTKQYIVRCLNSILSQMQNDIELIIVDDGSTDGSSKIIDEIAIRWQSVIKVIHKENGGQSEARNIGIEKSEGEYLFFVDSDDYLVDDIMSELMTELNKDADIVEFGFNVYRRNKIQKRHLPIPTDKNIDGYNYLLASMKTVEYEWFPWKYVFKRSLFLESGYSFPQGKYYEDVYLVPRLLLCAHNIRSLETCVYNYMLGREDATTFGIKFKQESDKLDIISTNIDYVNNTVKGILADYLNDSFSKLYFSALIVVNGLRVESERMSLYEKLKEKSYITKYAKTGVQHYLAVFIRLFGIKIVSKLLYLRMKIK